MCTMWVDGLNGVVRHIAGNADLVRGVRRRTSRVARDRGWDNVRPLSCGDNSFQYDLGAEDEEGE